MFLKYLFFSAFQKCLGTSVSTGRERETCSFIGDEVLDACIKRRFRFLVWLLQSLILKPDFPGETQRLFLLLCNCSVLKVYFHQNFHSEAANLFLIKRCQNGYVTEKIRVWWINLTGKFLAKYNNVCVKYQKKWYIFPPMKGQFHIKLVQELKQIISGSDFFLFKSWD